MDFPESLRSLPAVLEALGQRPLKDSYDQMLRPFKLQGALPIPKDLKSRTHSALARESVSAREVASLIASDPVTVIRLISLCNQTFYSRAQTINSVERAVSHLGIMRIGDVFDELGEVKSLSSAFLGRGISFGAYQHMILAGILARRLYRLISVNDHQDETALIVAYLGQSGRFLLSYARPNFYAACELDNLLSEHPNFERCFKKVFRTSAGEFAATTSEDIGLPEEIVKYARALDIPPWNRRSWTAKDTEHSRASMSAAYVAGKLAAEIMLFKGEGKLNRVIGELAAKIDRERTAFQEMLAGLGEEFVQSITNLGIPALRLPEYIRNYDELIVGDEGPSKESYEWPRISDRINPYLLELKACLKTSGDEFLRSPQAIVCSQQALLRGMNFDRVVLFRVDKDQNALIPDFVCGREVENITTHRRPISNTGGKHFPDLNAFRDRKPIFHGDPIFGEDWPFVAFPVIWQGEVQAVFYADKKANSNAEPLETEEQVTCIALAEVWHDVPPDFC